MFRKHHQGRKSNNIVFMFFRLLLSLVMFIILLGGIYAAYKHFSGLDPLRLDPQAVLSEILAGKMPKEALSILSATKITEGLSDAIIQKESEQQESKQIPSEDSAFEFLLVADSHSNNDNLEKAITQAKEAYPDLEFIIGLGDYTDVGTIGELKNAKKVFDKFGLRYFLVPGDHDLWDCRNRGVTPISCFNEVFGPAYQSFTFNNFQFLLLNNSDNYIGLGETQSKWITEQLEKAKKEGVKGIFVFLHEPLYHPSSEHVMGWVEKSLKSQAGGLIFQLKEAGVAKIFSGDIHYFSQYEEPQTKTPMVTVGAVTIERNPQVPRFAVVSVSEDGLTKAEDVEIK